MIVTIFKMNFIHCYLSGHPRLSPKDFVEPEIAEAYSKDYMFMACIKFINSVSIK